MRKLAVGLLAVSLAVGCLPIAAWAGQWQETDAGWRYQEDDGTYLTNCWRWIDGNGDGTAECYYFNKYGYMVAGRLTSDGYAVNTDGAWTVGGKVQTRSLDADINSDGAVVYHSMAQAAASADTDGDADAAGTGDAESADTETTAAKESISADEAIKSVTTLGRVEADGAKPYAVVVEYGVELDGADVSASKYEVWDFWMDQADAVELGSDPGAVTKVYVNDTPQVSTDGGTGSGRYVIIELNMDYQVSVSQTYYQSMAVSVAQTGDIEADAVTVKGSSTAVTNYDTVTYSVTRPSGETVELTENRARSGEFVIDDVDRYTIGVYHAEQCFEEATGEYTDLDLDYAIYVPEDYDAAKQYMLVLHIEDAGFLGTDAMLVLTEGQTPINLASKEMQQYAKSQGYGGVIVLCPQLAEEYRSARDNYTVSAALQATWKLLDSVIASYNIDTDRIYGTGQSMGGMQVMEMAAQRDNFFAAIMPVGCQWGSNYNKEDEYKGDVYYPTPVDGVYVMSEDAQGNPCDYQNFYYMLSDDNILSLNCADDSFSTTVWKELALLYSDLAGVGIPYTAWNPLTTGVAEQNELLSSFVASDNETGIYWAAFEGGSHMSTWVYADRLDAAYRWLLSQKASDETARGKVAVLANAFELADEQLKTEDRLIAVDEKSGESYYYVTGRYGAGTAGYNSGLYSMNGGAPVRVPGWSAE